MTQEEFNKLPLLLSRAKFREATGLSDHQIDDMKRAKQIKVYRPKPGKYQKNGKRIHSDHRYCKYYKVEAARLACLKL